LWIACPSLPKAASFSNIVSMPAGDRIDASVGDGDCDIVRINARPGDSISIRVSCRDSVRASGGVSVRVSYRDSLSASGSVSVGVSASDIVSIRVSDSDSVRSWKACPQEVHNKRVW
jgi:hypothetical protein